MADLSKLRNKTKPIITAARGSAILVAGGLAISSCIGWPHSGYRTFSDTVEGEQDTFISGKLLPIDVTIVLDEGTPPVDEGSAVDEGVPPSDGGTAVDEGTVVPDVFISGNLMPPDVIEMPK